MLRINQHIVIPHTEIETPGISTRGAGGQNIYKLETAATFKEIATRVV